MDGQLAFEEYPAFIPAGVERLCAILCVPTEQRHDLGVVLLTGGNYTRTHRNRMWVRAARELAARGFPSIRLDYHGVGDSTGRATIDLESPFDEDALVAARFLRRATGVTRVAMAATCFGGRTAIAAAARDPAVISATIFPVPVVLRHQPPPTVGARLRRWAKPRRPIKWLMRRPRVYRRRRAAVSQRRAAHGATSPRFRRDLAAYLKRGVVWFVYGERTPSLGELRRLLTDLQPELAPDQWAHLHVEVIPGYEVAGFQSFRDQDLAVQKTIETVELALRGSEDDLRDQLPEPGRIPGSAVTSAGRDGARVTDP
jgi:pimeloyl-ACP methyl ester carboxylesterase